VIVILVIFLFLQDWRATIIPAITIPVSLIGTFAFIKLFDFSINSLTLFGITLAPGWWWTTQSSSSRTCSAIWRGRPSLTDECVHDPHKATIVAMAEVTSAVIATSLVLISVFVPVSFFPGTTGIMYKQFSLTIAFSIAISAFNALTLSPALGCFRQRIQRGMMFVDAKPSDQRRGKGHSAADIVADLSPKLQSLMFAPTAAWWASSSLRRSQGVGSYGGFQFMLQDQGGNTLTDLDRVAHQIVSASHQQRT
jgi:multidrug efflux pump subunit AcrB